MYFFFPRLLDFLFYIWSCWNFTHVLLSLLIWAASMTCFLSQGISLWQMLNISCHFNFQKIMSALSVPPLIYDDQQDAKMQEIVSNLVLANSEILELDFWGSWKLLFCISFLPGAVSSVQPGFISFIVLFLYSLCFSTFCSCYLPHLSYCYW